MEESESEATKKREAKLVNSLCSFQSRLGPPEYRKWRRVHGLQLPLHPQQVMGWLVLVAVGTTTFLVLIPALSAGVRDVLLIVFASLFCLHVFSHVTALLLDPADPELKALKVSMAVPEFDRSKHAHVIENGRCHLCNIKTTGPKTKHCSVCNKCVDHFDHHCKWLNHCVGGRNYVAFLVCVVSAVVASLFVVGVAVLEIVYYHVDPSCLSFYTDRYNSTSSESFLSESVFLGVVSVLGLLAATTAGLLLHLCLFHCYISILGITTYEYIRNYRQGAHATPIAPHKCTCRVCHRQQTQVMTSREPTRDEGAGEGGKWYYSCSRPPEQETRGSLADCCPSLVCGESGRRKGRTLQRQNTDPDFVDRVVKPFVITFNDERRPPVSSAAAANRCVHAVLRTKCCVCCKDSTTPETLNKDQKKVIMKVKSNGSSRRRRFSLARLWVLCPRSSARPRSEPTKVKCNQIRPTTEEELNKALEKIAAMATEKQLELKLNAANLRKNSLPELTHARKLRDATELKELSSVLSLAEQPRLASRYSYRRGRKKHLRRPRSPSLSPIRESELSNPGSPHMDVASLQRSPSLAAGATIFLSDPNSPCSSDDETVVSPIGRRQKRTIVTEDVLQTPQLPRKSYSPRDEQTFVVRSSKLRPISWHNL